MRQIRLSQALLAAAVGAAALAGCRKEEPAPAVPPPTAAEPATTAPAPVMAPAPTSAATVTLGNAIGADNRIAAPQTTFASGDTIHASVETDGPARRLEARWTHLDSDQVVAEEQKDVAAGAQVTDFHISKPDGWPPGRYRLEVSQDGSPVGSSEFEVR
ncbi:MAG: hypothetical protein GXY30_13220 [Xanthomonadaceae bacterium]|nr:hypothetical protein [Xanthomonadaceae bacterium]